MKCPACGAELAPGKRDGVDAEVCSACGGTWMTAQELDQLEDEAFRLGDEEKGTLVFSSETSDRKCPQCSAALGSFAYRLYDLQLEVCPEGHGYWLDAGEDKRLLALMHEEVRRLKRSGRAEDHWATLKQHLRSHSLLQKLRDLFR